MALTARGRLCSKRIERKYLAIKRYEKIKMGMIGGGKMLYWCYSSYCCQYGRIELHCGAFSSNPKHL
jgi:hypothetical protein